MSAPGGILALDIAGHVGWAYGLAGMRAPMFGVWMLPSPHDSGRRYAAMGNQVADAITLHAPSLVIMEAPLVRQDSSARLLLGLCAVTEATCYWREVRCRETGSATARKTVLGRGTFPKGQAKSAVMAYCAEQDWRVPDDNAGDACVLWRYACIHMTVATRKAA